MTREKIGVLLFVMTELRKKFQKGLYEVLLQKYLAIIEKKRFTLRSRHDTLNKSKKICYFKVHLEKQGLDTNLFRKESKNSSIIATFARI
jgi:hypothetical protein